MAELLHIPVYRLRKEMPLEELIRWGQRLSDRAEGNQPQKEDPIDLEKATPDQLKALFG